MARRSLYGGSGTKSSVKKCSKVADYSSMSYNQANGNTLKVRRSSRLRKIKVIYESEASQVANLSLKQHQEIGTYTSVSSTMQDNPEIPMYENRHSPLEQTKDSLDSIDTDDDSTSVITLRDMITSCKTKKRKASEFNAQSNSDMQENNSARLMQDEEVELEETLFSLKRKRSKSCPSRGSLNEIARTDLHASLVENMPSQMPVSCSENLKAFTERSSKSNCDVKKEIIETSFGKSNNENCTNNSILGFINKCDLGNIYYGEERDNGNEGEDLGKTLCVTNQSDNEFFFPSEPTLNRQETPNHEAVSVNNELLVVCTQECESTTTVDLMAKYKQNNLSTERHEKDDQHVMQFDESLSFYKESKNPIAAENFPDLVEFDRKKLKCSLENNRWLDANKKHSLSDRLDSNRIYPLVSEFKASSTYGDIDGSIGETFVSFSSENQGNNFDRMNHGSNHKTSTLYAINSHKSLDIGGHVEFNTLYGGFGERFRESMHPASACIPKNISQMDCNILPSQSVVFVDPSCSITEPESPLASSSEDGKQAFYNGGSDCYHSTYYMLNADRWASQSDKLLPSSQMLMLTRIPENQPCCVNTFDLTDTVKPSGEIICQLPVSQLHEADGICLDKVIGLSKSDSMDAGTDLPISPSSDAFTKTCAERQINNIQTTKLKETDLMLNENQCMELEHCTKKLLSNRKEISPSSQEKLIRALNNGGLDDVVKLSNSMEMLCFDKIATKKPLSSILDNGEAFLRSEQMIKKSKTMNQSFPEVTKGILKSSCRCYGNPCYLKNSSIHTHDAILFSQRQMQDTENIAEKLLQGLNSLKSIVESTLFSGPYFSSTFNFDEIRLASKQASKLEVTTKKWLAMMSKDCTRFCKIMRLAESKHVSPVAARDIPKGRKRITFADEAGGTLCQTKFYERQPAAFIVPKI